MEKIIQNMEARQELYKDYRDICLQSYELQK